MALLRLIFIFSNEAIDFWKAWHFLFYFKVHSCQKIFEKRQRAKKLATGKVSSEIERCSFIHFTNLVEIWEHEWKSLAATQEVQDILAQSNVSEPLNPRDALYGGRTNAFKLYHKCREHEQIKYIDYTR